MFGGNIHEYWNGLHVRQSDWAFRAYSRLIETLSADVQEKLSLKDKDKEAEPYVVIFGKTQVGKTTLLLDLMGIEPGQMPIISKVMRGGREQGKSATATAMEYCHSSNERWGFTLRGETRWVESDQEMTQELGLIREEMEDGKLTVDAPCVIHIPKRFFGKDNSNTPKVRILDLPGDNPANKQEQLHVKKLADTYLPFADLILLVGRGDDLGFLRPEVVTLPRIKDWQAMPHRFRIVTTYSYTAKSIKDILRCDDNADKSFIRKRLIEQIEHFGTMSEAAKDEALYFPLEFGNSWASEQVNEPPFHRRMSSIITGLREELLDQISKATTPMGRLRNTLNTHHSVKHIQRKKEEEIKNQINKLAENEMKTQKELEIWNRSVEQSRKKLSKIDKILASQNKIKNQQLIEKSVRNPKHTPYSPFPPKLRDGKADVVQLQKLVSEYYRILPTLQLEISYPDNSIESKKYWIQVRKHLARTESHRVVRDILDDAFGSIRRKLSDYKLETYLWPGNYQKDLQLIRGSGETAKKALEKHEMDAWLAAINKVHGDYLRDQRAAQADLAANESEHGNAQRQLEVINHEQSDWSTQLEQFKQKSADDLERCERFENLLDEEYLDQLSGKMDGIYDTRDDCNALLQLFSCMEFKYQREELMKLNEQQIL